MKWITYQNVGIDRIACAWLIGKYIDRDAEFLFIEHGAKVDETAGTYFDIPGCLYSHRRGRCTFATMLKEYNLADPVLARMAKVIDGADCLNDVVPEPESYGLEALCLGVRQISSDDSDAFDKGTMIYDAFYAYLLRQEK